jgi:hypothetical protein
LVSAKRSAHLRRLNRCACECWASDWRSGPRRHPIFLLALRAATGIDHRLIRPIDTIGHLRVPILVLAGTEAVKTTREESRTLFARANPPKFCWEAPGAGHIDLAYADGEA